MKTAVQNKAVADTVEKIETSASSTLTRKTARKNVQDDIADIQTMLMAMKLINKKIQSEDELTVGYQVEKRNTRQIELTKYYQFSSMLC